MHYSAERQQDSAALHRPRQAALAAFLCSALEYYGFFVYGTASALAFGSLFFPSTDANAGTIAAFAAFGAAYVVRPIGAVLLGHLGDRLGRKVVLTVSLLLMGISSTLIGILPTYALAGIVAPITLVCLRIFQGISIGGQQAGASALTLEHAPTERRAFYASFMMVGTQTGLIAATLSFLPLTALPGEAFLQWGWRIPFLAGIPITGAAFWIHSRLPEAPSFANAQGALATADLPFSSLFRDGFVDVLRVALCACIASVSSVIGVFSLSFAVNQGGVDASTMLLVLLVGSICGLVMTPVWAHLADLFGRKPLFMIGALGSAAMIWPYLAAAATGSVEFLFVFGIALSVVYGIANGVWPAFYGEMFATRVRVSGLAFGTQIGFAVGGLAPAICAVLLSHWSGNWIPVACFVSAVAAVSAAAASTARETYRTGIDSLGSIRNTHDNH